MTRGLPARPPLSWLTMVAFFCLALAVRLPLLSFVTADTHYYVLPWYDDLVVNGIEALGREPATAGHYQGGADTPPFYYLLYAVSRLDGLLPRLALIKSIATVADIVLAGVVFLIVRQITRSVLRAQIGFLATFAAPTVIANSALWGQSDAIYSSLLLAATYASLSNRPALAFLSGGAAFAFKAQAVFLAPYLAMLLVARHTPWPRSLWAPVGYLVLMVPAWALGRPFVEILLGYVRQGGLYQKLSMNAPNVYYLMPGSFYAVGIVVGTLATVFIALAYVARPLMHRRPLNEPFLLLAAVVSLSVAPFFLPKMHDRYFFPADVLSIGLALSVPRLWFVPVVFQISSGLSYVPAISDGFYNFDYEYVTLMPVAAAINCCLVPYLLWLYWRESTLDGPLTNPQGSTVERS